MNATDALKFLAHEAKECRDRDASEAVCLLFPAVLKALHLKPHDHFEAARFRREFKRMLDSDFRFDAEPSRCGCGGRT